MNTEPKNIITADDEMDNYLKKFDAIENYNKQISLLVNTIDNQSDDQQRLYIAIRCIKSLINQNDKLLDLLIEMNNTFGSK